MTTISGFKKLLFIKIFAVLACQKRIPSMSFSKLHTAHLAQLSFLVLVYFLDLITITQPHSVGTGVMHTNQ